MNRLALSTVLALMVCSAHAGPFDNVIGSWRGQTEYRVTVERALPLDAWSRMPSQH